MKSHWIMHQGRPIFIADFSHFAGDAAGVRAECEGIKEALKREALHSVRSLTNVDGTFANEDVIRALLDLVPVTNTYIKKRAVIGVSGFRRHFLYAFAKVVGNLTFSVFDTPEEALDWLARD